MDALEATHQQLLSILTQDEAEALSYFEYTTLLAMLYFSKRCDFVILEAGLGGEHDATAVFENILTLVTPIDKDHEAFLGEHISDIAKTKLNAIQNCAILAKQRHNEVYDVLREIRAQKKIRFYLYDELLDESDIVKIQNITQYENLAEYLTQNLSLAIAALKYLKISYSVEDFYNARLFGRLTHLSKNVILDVGHNTLAARSILENLKEKQYILVYNSYKDKNYEEILSILKPIIKEVALIDVVGARVAQSSYLREALESLGIKYREFDGVKEDENYLVFGSFSVAEAFLKAYNG
jgi:dihydrofolate synthase/folylpolyglutamate synthase